GRGGGGAGRFVWVGGAGSAGGGGGAATTLVSAGARAGPAAAPVSRGVAVRHGPAHHSAAATTTAPAPAPSAHQSRGPPCRDGAATGAGWVCDFESASGLVGGLM